MNKTIIGLYTHSLDSKAAAALLKYYGKSNVILRALGHGSELPKGTPGPDNAIIISLGVNVTDYKDYEHHVIENDGKTSTAESIVNLSFKGDNKFIFLVNTNIVSPWIDLIKRFHVRTSCQVEDDAFAFNLISQNYNTYIDNNTDNYFWKRLIEDPSYFEYLLKEGHHILNFKKENYKEYIKQMFVLEINNKKCLVFNKREADSSGFLYYPDIENIDYFIAFQDQYTIKEISAENQFKLSLNELVDFILKSNRKLIFTVYRHKPSGNSVDFTSVFGGKGHAGVSTFSIDNPSFTQDDISINFTKLPGIYTNTEEQDFISSDDISPNVKKYKKAEVNYAIRLGLKLKDYKDNVMLITNNGFFPYNINSIDHVSYLYNPDYIKQLFVQMERL